MAWVAFDLFKDYLRDQVSVDDALIQGALDGGHRSVADHCKRSFDLATGTPSSRSYTPRTCESEIIRIHDCVSVTSITDNGTLIAAADYQLEPVNGLDWSGQAVPYEQARRYYGTWSYDSGFARCVVVADWGWEETPAAAIEATLIVAKDILLQRNNNSGVAGFGDFGAVRVRANPVAMGLLERLRRVEAFGVA